MEVPFHRLLPKWDSQEKFFHWMAPVYETKTNTTRVCACSGLVLHQINDYLQMYIWAMNKYNCWRSQWLSKGKGHFFNKYIKSIQCVQLNHISLMQCQISSYTYNCHVTYIVSAVGVTWSFNQRSKMTKSKKTFYQFSLHMQLLTQCQSIELSNVTTLQI